MEWRQSWVGSIRYRGREYEYRRCLGCGSLYAHPLPDAETLDLMSGQDYDRFLSAEESMWGESEIIRWLRTRELYRCSPSADSHSLLQTFARARRAIVIFMRAGGTASTAVITIRR